MRSENSEQHVICAAMHDSALCNATNEQIRCWQDSASNVLDNHASACTEMAMCLTPPAGVNSHCQIHSPEVVYGCT
jgi:hypothetical protein